MYALYSHRKYFKFRRKYQQYENIKRRKYQHQQNNRLSFRFLWLLRTVVFGQGAVIKFSIDLLPHFSKDLKQKYILLNKIKNLNIRIQMRIRLKFWVVFSKRKSCWEKIFMKMIKYKLFYTQQYQPSLLLKDIMLIKTFELLQWMKNRLP